jgi:hypothetical protein
VDDDDDDENYIHFFIICVLTQQPQGQLQRQHGNIRYIKKYNESRKTHMKEITKKHLRITA